MQPGVAPSNELVLASPLAVAERSGLTYIGGAIVNPVCFAAAVFAGCLGLGSAGLIGALIAACVVIAACGCASRSPAIRQALDRRNRARERARREIQRLKQLAPAGPQRRKKYLELRGLVDEVEHADASEAARFELEDLLDHFVQLALSQQRCLDALRIAGSPEFPQTTAINDPRRPRRRREIVARRVRHREDCLARVDRITDELEALEELVRLIVQRVACPPSEPDLDRELERRLWELDEVDAALGQLSA